MSIGSPANNYMITVTSPLLPDLDELNLLLKEIWASRWIANNGKCENYIVLMEKLIIALSPLWIF